MTTPTHSQIRKFLSAHFSDTELTNLCFDYFPPVEDEFTVGMTKSAKTIALIKYAKSQVRFNDLLGALRRERQTLYIETFEPATKVEPKSQSRSQPVQTKAVKKPKQIFLSHSSKDGEFAHLLADKLREKGWEIWIAPDSILPGEKWVEAINRGLEESSYFVLLITPDAVESRWVTLETNTAIALDRKDQIQLVPLEVKEADAPVLWQAFHWLAFKGITAKNLTQLENVLSREQLESSKLTDKPKSQPKMEVKAEAPLVSQTTAPEVSLPMLFIAAEKSYEIGDIPEAVKLFRQICELDKEGLWGKNAQGEIEKIEAEQAELARFAERDKAYEQVKTVASQSKRAGKIAWEEFSTRYPNHDPDSLKAQFVPPKPKRPAPFALPDPFGWIEIPKKGYSISKYPITNGQFGKFVEDSGYKTDKWWTKEGLDHRNSNSWAEPRYWQDEKWNGKNYPIVGVSWFEAVAFSRWMSEKAGSKIMLPTQEQWQVAAQGDDGRQYPWGNEWDGSCCNNNVDNNGVGKTTPVTQFEGKGDSPFGVVDMSGNVWEWCLTDSESKTNDVSEQATYRVLRGGSWNFINLDYFAVSFRNWYIPTNRNSLIGFRVALSL